MSPMLRMAHPPIGGSTGASSRSADGLAEGAPLYLLCHPHGEQVP